MSSKYPAKSGLYLKEDKGVYTMLMNKGIGMSKEWLYFLGSDELFIPIIM